jgi:Arc/MetJ-type ribon-helix-helix transcriptional regulator
MEDMPKKQVTVTLPKELLAWLDEQVATRTYADRSHAVEVAILTLKEKTEKKD